MIRRPAKVDLTESRRQELREEINEARVNLAYPKTLDGSHCAIWSEARAVVSNNERLLQRGYEMIIILEEE